MSNPHVLIETTSGDILVEIFADKATKTSSNFLEYVDSGFYNNTIFHRVIKGFMVQGGGYSMRLEKKEIRKSVENEAENGLKNMQGTVAMARTSDPHSAAAQFFINCVDNPELDFTEKTEEGFGYCVFGQIVDGFETVGAIEKVKVRSAGEHENLPVDSVLITNISRFDI